MGHTSYSLDGNCQEKEKYQSELSHPELDAARSHDRVPANVEENL